MVQNPEWFQVDRSTFTHLGRNDRAVDFSVGMWSKGTSQPATDIRHVLLLGSGPVEPFTLAALPGLVNAKITAVDINADVIALGQRIKEGDAISWSDVAQVSKNPDRENKDFIDVKRVQRGIDTLRKVDSLSNLGVQFTASDFRVPMAITERVTFVHLDALSALQEETITQHPDIIGDFFVQVNINKDPALVEQEYSHQIAQQALHALHPNGLYVIGDTGANLGSTLGYFPIIMEGYLNGTSMVHAVCREPGKFTTSHYVMASRRADLFLDNTSETTVKVQDVAQKEGVTIQQESMTLDKLVEEVKGGKVNIAYIPDSAFNLEMGGLATMLPAAGNEKSFGVIFPEQK